MCLRRCMKRCLWRCVARWRRGGERECDVTQPLPHSSSGSRVSAHTRQMLSTHDVTSTLPTLPLENRSVRLCNQIQTKESPFLTAVQEHSLGHIFAGFPPWEVRHGPRMSHVDEGIVQLLRDMLSLRLGENWNQGTHALIKTIFFSFNTEDDNDDLKSLKRGATVYQNLYGRNFTRGGGGD